MSYVPAPTPLDAKSLPEFTGRELRRISDSLLPAAFWRQLNPRTQAERVANVIPTSYAYSPGDVRRYGAKLDLTTDDSDALTSAIAQAREDGANVIIPGRMLVNINAASNLFSLGDGIVISGAGQMFSEIRTTGTPSADRTILFIEASHDATIQGLKITGPSSDGSGFSKGVRHGGTTGRVLIYDTWFSQLTDGFKKDSGSGCGIYVDYSRFTDIRSAGILDVASSGRLHVTNSVFDGIGSSNLHHGIYHQAPFTELIVNNCYFRNISGYGIHRFSTTGSGTGAVIISNCHGANNTTGDLIIDDVSGAVNLTASIENCSFRSATGVAVWASNLSFSNCILVCSSKCVDTTGASGTGKRVSFSSCHFRFGGTLAVELTSSDQQYWSFDPSCTFTQTGSGTSDTAIRVDGSTDIDISGRFIMNGGQPWRIRDSADRIHFKDVQIHGTTNTTGGYILSSATDPGDYTFDNVKCYQSDRGLTIEVSGAHVQNCDLRTPSSKISLTGGKTLTARNNRGYVTESSGTGSIASGATTATITHGLSVTPSVEDILITFAEQGTNDYGRWWISGISSTQFTLNVSADPGASNLDFGWQAQVL